MFWFILEQMRWDVKVTWNFLPKFTVWDRLLRFDLFSSFSVIVNLINYMTCPLWVFWKVLSSIFKLFFSDPLCLFFFKMVFLSSETRQWFIDAGRQALSAVIESAGKVKYWVQTLAFDCMCIFLWLLTISVADIS